MSCMCMHSAWPRRLPPSVHAVCVCARARAHCLLHAGARGGGGRGEAPALRQAVDVRVHRQRRMPARAGWDGAGSANVMPRASRMHKA